MLLGIGHKARQGKDEVGEYLKRNHGFKILHFADPLKEEAKRFGWTPQNKNETAYNIWKIMPNELSTIFPKSMKPRKTVKTSFLQWLGTSYREMYGEDHWVEQLDLTPGVNMIVCDMRYINELLAIKKYGGFTIDIQRYCESYVEFPYCECQRDSYSSGSSDIPIQNRYIDDARPIDHPSEIELDDMPHDFTLRNDYTLERLYAKVDAMIKYIENV